MILLIGLSDTLHSSHKEKKKNEEGCSQLLSMLQYVGTELRVFPISHHPRQPSISIVGILTLCVCVLGAEGREVKETEAKVFLGT